MSRELLTEKYRPKTLDDYVWSDPSQRKKVEQWIKEGSLPHLIFSGHPGVGKTSLALLLLRELNIPEGDILKIDASGKDRKADEFIEKFNGFVSTWALNDTGIKYIILDEADSMSPLSQRSLRNAMETYSDVCRIVFTCNYPNKIIQPLHDRSQSMHFEALSKDEFLIRMLQILEAENIEFLDENGDVSILDTYISSAYPSMRKCINLVQEHIIDNKLHLPKEKINNVKDYMLEIVALFKAKKFVDARKMIVDQAQVEEYSDIYRFFYRNLELFGRTQDEQDDALLIIRNAVVRHNTVSDVEINLAACICELSRIGKPGF